MEVVFRQGLLLTSIGVAIGLAFVVAIGSLISSLLFGITPRDPATLVGVAVVVFAVAAAALRMPALRASRSDPLTTLRDS